MLRRKISTLVLFLSGTILIGLSLLFLFLFADLSLINIDQLSWHFVSYFALGFGLLEITTLLAVIVLYASIIIVLINFFIMIFRQAYIVLAYLEVGLVLILGGLLLLSALYNLQQVPNYETNLFLVTALPIFVIVGIALINAAIIMSTKAHAKVLKYNNKFARFFSNWTGGKLRNKTEGINNFSDYKKPSFKFLYLVLVILVSIISLTSLLPIAWLFLTSFKGMDEVLQVPYQLFPNAIDFGKFIEVWAAIGFEKYLLNTLIVVVGAIICSVLFNGLLAYGISIIKPKGYKIAFYLIMLSYMIPAILSIVPLFLNIANMGLINTYVPLWLAFGANAYYFILFKNYFDSIPKSIIEAAKVDGAGHLRIFFQQVVPLSMPVISIVAIFTMTASWSDFILPYQVLKDDNLKTIMVKIFDLQSQSTEGFTADKLLMLLVITMIPQIIIFIIFQRRIMNSNLSSGLKE